MGKYGARIRRVASEASGAQLPHRPVVCEDEAGISLHFDRRAVQSAMYRDDPFALVLGYTRLMMGFQLFQPAPRELLIIGLGGGSLSKYGHRHLPRTRITTVEIDERIIALRDTFAIPPDDDRFRIVHANGADFIAGRSEAYDVMLLDGYDAAGLPGELSSQNFYDGCAAALAAGGVLMANFVQGDERVEEYLDRIGNAFGGRSMTLWSENRGNIVACALKQAVLPTPQVLLDRARDLEQRQAIDFRLIASKLMSSARTTGGGTPPTAGWRKRRRDGP